jgi:hypothetical protein
MDDVDDDEGRNGLGWMFHGFLLFVTFVAGFMSGMLSDGTAETINGFKASNRTSMRSAAPQPSGTDASATAAMTATSPPTTTDPVVPMPGGTVEWNISVAPGTQITELAVLGGRVEVPTRLRFYALARGAAPSLTASVWVDKGGDAAISLPAGYYRVGSVSLREGVAWDKRAGDEKYLSKPLRIEILDPDQKGPTLTIDGEGGLKSSSVLESAKRIVPTRRRRRDAPEYEGLGTTSEDSTTGTYG